MREEEKRRKNEGWKSGLIWLGGKGGGGGEGEGGRRGGKAYG